MLASHHQQKNRAAQTRIQKLGRAMLHIQPSGENEWLWGHFVKPINEEALQAHEFTVASSVPVVTLLDADALNIQYCSRKTRYDANDQVSLLVIDGFEYAVDNKHITGSGTTKVMLSESCQPKSMPVAIPHCYDACKACQC